MRVLFSSMNVRDKKLWKFSVLSVSSDINSHLVDSTGYQENILKHESFSLSKLYIFFSSISLEISYSLPLTPFLLNTYLSNPSFFEILFLSRLSDSKNLIFNFQYWHLIVVWSHQVISRSDSIWKLKQVWVLCKKWLNMW